MRDNRGERLPRRTLLRRLFGGVAGSALLALAGCTNPPPVPPTPTSAPVTTPTEPAVASPAPSATATPQATPDPTVTAAPDPRPTATPPPTASQAATASPQPSPTAQASPTPGAQTVIRLATNHAAVEVPWFRKVLETFQRDNPSLRAEQTNVPALYVEKVASWASDGKLPDVVFTRSVHAAAWAFKSWITSIDDLVARDAQALNLSDLHPAQVEELKLDGKWLLLPYDYDVHVLYSRADAFGEVSGPPTDDWTWSDLAAAAKRVTRRDGSGPARWGFAWAADASALPGLWLSEAGTFRRDDGRGIAIATPDHVRITQWLADLALVEGASPKPGDSAAGSLVAGGLASEVSGAWAAAGYRSARTDVLATGLPKGAAGRRPSYGAGTGWGLARMAKEREGAWKLLRHLSSRDSLEILVALPVRSLPGRLSAASLWQASLEALGAPKHPEAIIRTASEGFPHRQAVWWLNYQDIFGELMPGVWSGARKAADVLPELERRVNAAAARYFA